MGRLLLLLAAVWSVRVQALVSVFVHDIDGFARLEYKCSAGETIRSFALDMSVDRGRIVGVHDYFRGESTEQAQGYGVFPASLRDQILTANPLAPRVDWNVSDYSPLASAADAPGDTLPGLGSAGVTLEFAALWNVNQPSAKPAAQGLLCVLELTESAVVTVSPNVGRGGVVSANPGDVITTVFTEGQVTPVRISDVSAVNGTLTVRFSGGELQTATALDGQWTGTGDADGEYVESVQGAEPRFYRVYRHP